MKRQRQIAAFGGALLIALIGLAGYLLTVWLLTARPLPPRPPAASGQPRASAAAAVPTTTSGRTSPSRTPLYWYDPMVPAQRFAKPGRSPFMDMQLVPKYADDADRAGAAVAGSIAVDARVVQNLGVRLAEVGRGSFARAVDTVGVVAVDEHRIAVVQVRAPGWVEQLDVRAVGDAVRRGQRLAAVYSPDLLATQQELLLARAAGDQQMIAAARERLALSGLAASQIAAIEKSGVAARRVNYYAPFDGYVMALGVRQGAAVQTAAMMFQLADPRTVWIIAAVAEAQAGWIKPDDAVQVRVPALPGERFVGRVDYLYPDLAAATRTLQLRVVLANPGNRLRPGMFATTQLRGAPGPQVLFIPTEAVIKTGERSVVIIAEDATHFRPALVEVGAEHDGTSEILAGLAVGQRVVASGQFLIDAEANLRGAFDNLGGSGVARQSGVELMPAQSQHAPPAAQ